MHPTITDWIQATATVLMFGTAIIALIVAAKAPRAAAKFAEDFRRQNATADEMNRWRLATFATLMAYRSEILNWKAREAINTVDVAFAAFPEVRDARRLFIEATLSQQPNATAIIERYHGLIDAIARALSLSNQITGFDIRAGYYPEAAGKFDTAALIEAEEKIARKQVPNLKAHLRS